MCTKADLLSAFAAAAERKQICSFAVVSEQTRGIFDGLLGLLSS